MFLCVQVVVIACEWTLLQIATPLWIIPLMVVSAMWHGLYGPEKSGNSMICFFWKFDDFPIFCLENGLAPINSKICFIFSNYGGQFKCIFRHLRQVNFKIFSNHGGQFKCIFSHLRRVNFKIFSNHGGWIKGILSYLRTRNFKILGVFSYLRTLNFKISPTMVEKKTIVKWRFAK